MGGVGSRMVKYGTSGAGFALGRGGVGLRGEEGHGKISQRPLRIPSSSFQGHSILATSVRLELRLPTHLWVQSSRIFPEPPPSDSNHLQSDPQTSCFTLNSGSHTPKPVSSSYLPRPLLKSKLHSPKSLPPDPSNPLKPPKPIPPDPTPLDPLAPALQTP